MSLDHRVQLLIPWIEDIYSLVCNRELYGNSIAEAQEYLKLIMVNFFIIFIMECVHTQLYNFPLLEKLTKEFFCCEKTQLLSPEVFRNRPHCRFS